LDGAEAVHYTTEVEQRESEEIGIETPGLVVPNCMDFSEFDNLPERGRFRQRIGVHKEAPVLLFLGRLEPRKGIDISLRAFAAAKEDVPDAQFVIAGPGEEDYLQTLKQLAGNLGVEESTTFTGYVNVDERLEALVDADVFILTSHTENFAMAAVEAMAAKTPVLLSDQVGVAGGAATAGAGVSVPLEQDAIVRELRRLLYSPSMRDEMGGNGPRHVRRTYGQDAVASQLIRAVREREKAESSNASALHSK
jgi:glycosyltransferase involved in cell wall biosynthesis